jgi:hypothetical protein
MSKIAKEATKLQSTSVCPGTDPAPKAQGRWIAAARERVATIQVQAHSYSVQHKSVDECERHTTKTTVSPPPAPSGFLRSAALGQVPRDSIIVGGTGNSWPNHSDTKRAMGETQSINATAPPGATSHYRNNRSFQEATIKAAPNSVNMTECKEQRTLSHENQPHSGIVRVLDWRHSRMSSDNHGSILC